MNNKQTLFAAVSLSLSLSTQADTVQYLNVEATGLNRDTQSNDLACLGNNCENSTTQNIILNSKDADFGTELGVTVTYGRDIDLGTLELSGTYYGKWEGSKLVVDVGEDINPIADLQNDDDDWTDAYSHEIKYNSELWGTNLTLSKPFKKKHTLSYGLSYFNLSEDFNWNTVDAEGQLPGANGNANYKIETKNQLYGAIIGLEGDLWKLSQKSNITYGIKGGAYLNKRKQSGRIENDLSSSPDIGRGENSDSGFSGLIDARIGMDYHFNKTTKLDFGVRGMYLSNVAFAPDQITFGSQNDGAALDARLSHKPETDSLKMFGAYLGLKKRF